MRRICRQQSKSCEVHKSFSTDFIFLEFSLLLLYSQFKTQDSFSGNMKNDKHLQAGKRIFSPEGNDAAGIVDRGNPICHSLQF